MPARRSYTAAFKLNVVAYAKETGNRAAGNLFCVNEKQIRYWKKQEDLLRLCHKSKRANRGGSARWSLLEDLLETWVLEQVATGRSRLPTKLIQQKAKAIAREENFQGFIGGPAWCFRFMRRKKLSFVSSRQGRNKDIENIQQAPATPHENDLYNLTLLTGIQMSKNVPTTTTTTTSEPQELLLQNIDKQISFSPSQVENDVNEIKEEPEDDQPDCHMPIIVDKSESPDMTHQGADSVTMDTCQSASRRLLIVPGHQFNMMSSLSSMWKEQKMCDASIGNGTTVIKVHKIVLLAISPALLSSSEVRSNCFLRVNFPANISENAMRAFAEYMYNGLLDLDPLTLTQLQQISYQLGIEDLRLLCETHLYSQTQSLEKIICLGTSLAHIANQSESSSSQMSLQHKQNSHPEMKQRSLLTNSWVQSSQGQNLVSHPVVIKTEPQNSIQVYGSVNPALQTHSVRTPSMAWSVSEATHSSSMSKTNKMPKTFQEHDSLSVESTLISHIKAEPINQPDSDYVQFLPAFSNESSTSNCLQTKCASTHATNDCSDTPKLNPSTSSSKGTVSNIQQKILRNQAKVVATAPTLSSSSRSRVPQPTLNDSTLMTAVQNTHFSASARNKLSTSETPYPVMLFSSELETLPLNVTQTNKKEQYVDLTSS